MILKFGGCISLPDNGALGISNLRVILEPWMMGWGGGCSVCIRATSKNCNLKMNLLTKAVTQPRKS